MEDGELKRSNVFRGINLLEDEDFRKRIFENRLRIRNSADFDSESEEWDSEISNTETDSEPEKLVTDITDKDLKTTMGYLDDSTSSSSSSDSEGEQTPQEIPPAESTEEKNVGKDLNSSDENHSLNDVKEDTNRFVTENDLPIVVDSQDSNQESSSTSSSSSSSDSESESEDITPESQPKFDPVVELESETELSELPVSSDKDDNSSVVEDVGSSGNHELALKTDFDVDTTVLRKEVSSSSSSSSSSESETEEEGARGPLVVRQNYDNVPGTSSKEDMGSPDKGSSSDDSSIALALKTALEEREKELQQNRDLENDQDTDEDAGPRRHSKPVSDYVRTPSPEAFDFSIDPSLRARTASDFEPKQPPELPPKLPPKQRDLAPNHPSPYANNPEITVRRETDGHSSPEMHTNIFHVKDKTASLGRGMWSDEDDSRADEYKDTKRFQDRSRPAQRQPHRVIDFTKEDDQSLKRNRSRSKSGRKRSSSRRRSRDKQDSASRSPSGSRSGRRVIDFSGKPYEDPNDVIRKQDMISLQAMYDTEAYDSVPETGDELNKLIQKANSLNFPESYVGPDEDVFPKKKLKEKKLECKHHDAFAKIVAPIPNPPSIKRSPEADLRFRSIPRNSEYSGTSSDNSKRSNRSNSKKKKKPSPVEGIDGDDETSAGDSDSHRFQTIQVLDKGEPSLPFVTEIYPSDYTEFESFSEAEFHVKAKPARQSSSPSDYSEEEQYNTVQYAGAGGESAYDTVADNDLETDLDYTEVKLNPIVSADYQICSDLGGNKSKSFPARLRVGKPKKSRPSLEPIAIALNQHHNPRAKHTQPHSIGYLVNHYDDEEFDPVLRRIASFSENHTGSFTIAKPNIVVHRQATHPDGYRPEIVTQNWSQKQPRISTLPEKKSSKKKEKKLKQAKEKVVPQIHLSLSHPEDDSNINNNLQINLLPSDDPNVVNLNIKSQPQSLPPFQSQAPTPQVISEPMSMQYIQTPVTVHAPADPPPLQDQSRVVDVIAPKMIVTDAEQADDNNVKPYLATTGGVVLAGGTVAEILPSASTTAPQYTQPAPVISTVPYQTVSLGAPAPVMAAQVVPQPTVAAILPQLPALPENNQGIAPEEKSVSLPRSLGNEKGSGRMHHGDSGIDLTVHDRNQRRSSLPARERGSSKGRKKKKRSSKPRTSVSEFSSSSSSSDSNESRRRRRKSSKRKLKTNDYRVNMEPSREYMDWYRSEYLKPSCCYLFMKHTMFLVNLIFTIVGLALIGLGIWGLTNLYTNGINDPQIIFLDPLFTVMIGGFIITLVAFHGAAGFVRDNVCMLRCFGSLLVILFIVFMVGGIVFWAMMSEVKKFTISSFHQLEMQYDKQSRPGLSFGLDLMQNSFQCCGISSPGVEFWSKNPNFKCPAGVGCPLPSSCCIHTKDQDPDFTCTSSSALSHKQSCINALTSAVRDNTPIIIGVWIGIWALMVIEQIFIYFMCKEIMYLKNIRDFIAHPVKLAEPKAYTESDDSSESEEESESSSSEDEYKERKRKRKRRRFRREREGRSEKKSRRGRRGSYHVNRTFSIQDERESSRGRRHRGSSKSKRSRSRGRRGSF